ncbi:MAG: oligosaccharide flippase family protein [Halorientalis sp.]
MSDPADDASVLAKQGGITFAGKVVMRVLEFAFLAAVTRLLAPSAYGVFALGVAIVLVVQRVATLNLNRSIDYFVPSYLSDEEYGKAKGVLVTVVLVSLALSLVGAAIVYLATPTISALVDEPELAAILPLFCVAIPLLSMYRVSLNAFNSIKRMRFRLYTQNLVRPISKLLLATGFLVAGLGVSGLVAGYIGSLVLAILVGITLMVTRVEWIRDAEIASVPYRSLVSYSSPLMLVGAMQGILGRIDYFLLGLTGTSADIGVYKVGTLLAGNLGIVLMSVIPIFKPMIAERKDDPAALQSNYELATRWIVMALLPLAITLALAPRTYLSLLFTPEYAGADVVVVILVVGYVVNGSFGPEARMLEGLGHTRYTLVNSILLVGTNVVLNLLLIPTLGMVGAAIGTSTALVVAGGAGVIEVYYLKQIHPYSRDLLRIWLAGGLTLLASLPVVFVLDGQLLTAIALPVTVLSIYLVSMRTCGGFTQADSKIARSIDMRLGYDLLSRVITVDPVC